MQEETTQKTIALTIKAAKLDADVLKAALRMYLNRQKQKGNGVKAHGKTTVKHLVGEGAGVSSIEINDGNIKAFGRVARKYHVDYAVRKDKTAQPPKYLVFFKGKDADVLSQAFKEFVCANEKKKAKVSVKEKLRHFREAADKDRNGSAAGKKTRTGAELMSRILDGIAHDLKSVPDSLKAKFGDKEAKKLFLMALPYVIAGYICDKAAWLWRVSAGGNASDKMVAFLNQMDRMFASPFPSLNPKDLLAGICCGIALRLAVYWKAKNAKKFRQGVEYGSAR